MAEVCIAAAPSEDAPARGLGAALSALGFEASTVAPAEAEMARAVDEAKCVLAVWSLAPAPPWLVVLTTLALERGKLVCVELASGAAPAPFKGAPRIDLSPLDRAEFKTRFEALIAEIEKLTSPTEGDADALPDALALARAGLIRPVAAPPAAPPPAAPPAARPAARRRWNVAGALVLAVGVLFVIGFGAGRLLNASRSGSLLVASQPVPAAPPAEAAPYGVTLAELETLPWREAAAKLNADAATRIKAEAEGGDSFAATLACLGHMAGAEGFLPSPAAARGHCDAAAAQNYPAALYLSWALRRAAPHVAVDEATARARLAEAARMGWLAAQVDYALVLAPDARAPLPDQTEAGRLWLAAAERGDARAQFYYARWLRDSRAGPRDPAASVPFLERAAAHNQLDALHMLATFYRDGIGVRSDNARARELYERAAVREHPPSMFNLAALIDGGSTEDRARAIMLYRTLACIRDEQQIQPLAAQRLRALRQPPAACG